MARFKKHGKCPECGSKDNLAIYDDGGAYCFTPTCGYVLLSDGTERNTENDRYGAPVVPLKLQRPCSLKSRGITRETCESWHYKATRLGDTWAQVANYMDGEVPITQKIRGAGKRFHLRGRTRPLMLYGEWLWSPYGGDALVLVEGEIDALTVYQVMEGQLPVVSVPNGADGAVHHVYNNLDWLHSFRRIVLMFDNDSAGKHAMLQAREAVGWSDCVPVLLPCKDANEMLTTGRTEALRGMLTTAVECKSKSYIGGSKWVS